MKLYRKINKSLNKNNKKIQYHNNSKRGNLNKKKRFIKKGINILEYKNIPIKKI